MKTLVKQKEDFFNPYFFENKQIQNIYFFDNTGIKANLKWFIISGSNNDYPEFYLPCKIERKLKENFNIKNAYYLKNNERFFEGINLYIPLDLFKHEFINDVFNYETNLEKNYYDVLKIDIESKKRCLKLDENKNVIRYIEDFKFNTIQVKFNHKTIDKDLKIKCKSIAQEFKDFNISQNISFYDVERLLNKYELIKK